MGEIGREPAAPRLPAPTMPRGPEPPIKRWFGRAKRRLGYYRARNRFREPPFRAALRPTDTFLVGHPKSGNTWLAYMLAIVLAEERAGAVSLYNVGDFVPFVHGRDHEIADYDHLPDPRVFRNEAPLHPRLYPRTLYLMRDPRAVLVSFWHMYQTMFDDRGLRLERFVEDYLNETGCFTYWNKHLIRWDRQVLHALGQVEARRAVCMVKYEELVADRRTVLERVATFIGAEPSEAHLAAAVERGSFEAMRGVEDRHGAEAYEGRARGEGRFIRRGQVAGWRDEMDPEIVTKVEAVLGPAMRVTGYLS